MKTSGEKQKFLSALPSVDELLRGAEGTKWLATFPKKVVLQGIRTILDSEREKILSGASSQFNYEAFQNAVTSEIQKLSSYSLLPLINATGIVLHTNLGRAVLSEKAIENIVRTGRGYSNLEYDLGTGKRGKRHSHTRRLLRHITGAEDALIVNNNAAAVLLCLNTMAKGKEAIVSRGELVEIGGSFRVPDVMTASSALLREVGTTNKTHLHDYSNAINENTALILKVHQSNYQITGFTAEVGIGDLVALGKKKGIPVMYDLGSGCLIDLKPYGIHTEPTVQEIIGAGVDIVTFSGDKLFGGPQGGVIAGKSCYIEKIQKNPLARALRVDKMTIAGFEATLMMYMDLENAKNTVPVLKMLFQPPGQIKQRALKIANALRKSGAPAEIRVIEDVSKAGGGSLPDANFKTFTVQVKTPGISVNELESRLRQTSPPVVARIREDALVLDARTINDREVNAIIQAVSASLKDADS
jgi:L-seryl-tRNA(Ser) seleniumtransferase